MKRRILSILGSAVLLCGIVAGSVTNVSASGKELKQVVSANIFAIFLQTL